MVTTLFSTLTTLKIASNGKSQKNSNFTIIETNEINYQQDQIGKIIIEKINIDEPLFKIESSENTIEKHVTILKESIFPDQDNSIIFIAAHSGTGKIAYFEQLDQLEKNDIVTLIYQKKEYKYTVKNIWEEKKNGYINVNKEKDNQLILTTCSPTKKNYQLVINCIKK